MFLIILAIQKNSMRKIIYFILFLIFGCKANIIEPVSPQKSYQVVEQDVSRTLKILSSDEFEGRAPGSNGIEKAALFLEGYLKENKIVPYFNSYRDQITNFNTPTYNIVGYVPGNDPELKKEFLIIGAHYDHIGLSTNGSDRINNGANDNASGVTAIAEVAKYFSQTKSNKRSILVVFFTGEEKGLLGSKHLAKKLKNENFNLYMMLNFEMVGVPMKKDFLAYLTGYEKSNMARKINEYAGKNIIGFLPKEIEYQLFFRSDNFSFYKEFDVPSQTLSTFDFENYNFYHDVEDEFKLMDIRHMTDFIQSLIPAVEKVSNTETKEIALKK
jgi:Zn-dependent M28 family amino/carboxypeptidase